MAKDMINSLEKMKVTLEEEEVIATSKEGRNEEIDSCSQSLIGKFLTCKPFNKKVTHSTLRRAWRMAYGRGSTNSGSGFKLLLVQV